MRNSVLRTGRVQLFASVSLVVLVACGGAQRASVDTASSSGSLAPDTATKSAVSAQTMVRGTVTAVTGNDLAVQADSGTVHVQLAQPVEVYDRKPATLARVTPNAFIGVTTVKQPDGTEQATEIHVFPEALRGLGEGSRPMTQNPSGSTNNAMKNGSTMTNGSAMTNGSTMTNGSASGSTMSNGKVSSASGTTMVVQYAGGSKTVSIPPNTPVTEIVATSKPLAAGDQVVVVATKASGGALTSNKVLLSSNMRVRER